jgi:hypothetical protein
MRDVPLRELVIAGFWLQSDHGHVAHDHDVHITATGSAERRLPRE